MLYVVGVSLRFFFPNVRDDESGRGYIWVLPGEEALLRRHPAGPAYGAVRTGNSAPTYEDLLALQDAIGDVESGLAPEQMNVLPTVTFSKEEHIEDAPSCPICLEYYQEGDILRVLPCSEQFHKR